MTNYMYTQPARMKGYSSENAILLAPNFPFGVEAPFFFLVKYSETWRSLVSLFSKDQAYCMAKMKFPNPISIWTLNKLILSPQLRLLT